MEGIPIRNLYLLLCYALEQLPEASEAPLGQEQAGGYLELLARLLVARTRHALHRGMDRGHVAQRELLGTVRGRIDIGATIQGLQHKKAKLWCDFEDHLPDLLHNQILLATLKGLTADVTIHSATRRDLAALVRRLGLVSTIRLRAGLFGQVHLGRNNQHYRLLIGLCELIFHARLPEDRQGITRFYRYLRDQFNMASIFENFLRNFLKIHGPAKDIRVLDRRGIPWTLEEDPEWAAYRIESLIPAMEADILLQTPNRFLVLDAKYYERTTRVKFQGSPKLYSGNLYQIQAYVEALSQSDLCPPGNLPEGMLIYPTTDETPAVTYRLRGHRYHVRTLNLMGEWEDIAGELLRHCLSTPN